MSNLKEIKTAMPAQFVEKFREKAESLGMTHRQLAATCFAIGFKSFSQTAFCEGVPPSLPSEPSPVVAEIAEKTAVSRGDAGAGAKRSSPLTLKAVFSAISQKQRGASGDGKGSSLPLVGPLENF